MRVLKRRPRDRKKTCLVVPGVTRASRIGVAIVEDGKQVAWGPNEDAAWASYHVSKAG